MPWFLCPPTTERCSSAYWTFLFHLVRANKERSHFVDFLILSVFQLLSMSEDSHSQSYKAQSLLRLFPESLRALVFLLAWDKHKNPIVVNRFLLDDLSPLPPQSVLRSCSESSRLVSPWSSASKIDMEMIGFQCSDEMVKWACLLLTYRIRVSWWCFRIWRSHHRTMKLDDPVGGAEQESLDSSKEDIEVENEEEMAILSDLNPTLEIHSLLYTTLFHLLYEAVFDFDFKEKPLRLQKNEKQETELEEGSVVQRMIESAPNHCPE